MKRRAAPAPHGCVGVGACACGLGSEDVDRRPIPLSSDRALGNADTPGQDRTGDLQRVSLTS